MQNGKINGVLASVKHFIGDGATLYGADEGNVNVGNYQTFLKHNIEGYKGSISVDVGTVMCSYSAINWVTMSIGPQMQYILRENLKFSGFVISDYLELGKISWQQLPTDFQKMEGY